MPHRPMMAAQEKHYSLPAAPVAWARKELRRAPRSPLTSCLHPAPQEPTPRLGGPGLAVLEHTVQRPRAASCGNRLQALGPTVAGTGPRPSLQRPEHTLAGTLVVTEPKMPPRDSRERRAVRPTAQPQQSSLSAGSAAGRRNAAAFILFRG